MVRLHRSFTVVVAAAATLSCQGGVESPSSANSVDGVAIRYEVHGAGEPSLVLVHGWSCDRTYWDAQIAHFDDSYRVVTVDLAGHGESGLGRESWTIAAFGQDVVAVVEELGLDRAVLVGHSVGGPVVLEAARRLGDRVIGVVGADTFGDVSQTYTQAQVDRMIEPFRTDFAAAMRNFVEAVFVAASDSALVEWVIEDMSAAPPEIAIAASLGSVDWWHDELADALRDVRAPIRLINSDMNPTYVEAGRRYASSFDARVMTGVGHFVMMEDPETFNRLLEELVQQSEAFDRAD